MLTLYFSELQVNCLTWLFFCAEAITYVYYPNNCSLLSLLLWPFIVWFKLKVSKYCITIHNINVANQMFSENIRLHDKQWHLSICLCELSVVQEFSKLLMKPLLVRGTTSSILEQICTDDASKTFFCHEISQDQNATRNVLLLFFLLDCQYTYCRLLKVLKGICSQ